MRARILLLNPPIYDFAAYDFWLKPYGLLRVAGFLREKADFQLFDFLDRASAHVTETGKTLRADSWRRGEYYAEPAVRPSIFDSIPHRYPPFHIPREASQK